MKLLIIWALNTIGICLALIWGSIFLTSWNPRNFLFCVDWNRPSEIINKQHQYETKNTQTLNGHCMTLCKFKELENKQKMVFFILFLILSTWINRIIYWQTFHHFIPEQFHITCRVVKQGEEDFIPNTVDSRMWRNGVLRKKGLSVIIIIAPWMSFFAATFEVGCGVY